MDFFTAAEEVAPFRLQILTALVTAVVVSLTFWSVGRFCKKKRVKPAKPIPKQRIRKRDRLRSWVRSASERVGLRRINSEGSLPRIRKRDRVLRVARELFKGLPAAQPPLSTHRRGPQAPPLRLLEPSDDMTSSDVPLDIRLTLQSMRVFGHLDQAVFAELYKHVETIRLKQGQSLFTVGDPDDSMYIVLRGTVCLRQRRKNAVAAKLSILSAGDNLSSLLSLLDTLSGSDSRIKTVDATAQEDDTAVLKIPSTGFKTVIKEHPETLRQIVRVVTIRLQRVTLLVLHRYCGLSHQLVQSPDTPSLPRFLQGLAPTQAMSQSKDTLQQACDHIAKLLDIEDETDWRATASLEEHGEDEVIVDQGDSGDLMFVLCGKLQHMLGDKLLYEVHAGMFTGELVLLSSIGSFSTLVAAESTVVVRLPTHTWNPIMLRRPSTVARLTSMALRLVSPFVRQVDFTLNWLHLSAGKALYEQGSDAHSISFIINGRVRSVTEANGKKQIDQEYGRLEVVGDIEVLTNVKRATTVIAVRDTELVKIPGALLHAVKSEYPEVLLHIMGVLGKKMHGKLTGRSERRSKANLNTIALLPVSSDVPMTAFVAQLRQVLALHGSTAHLNGDIVRRVTGLNPNCTGSLDEYQLSGWLESQEDRHQIVLYETDSFFSHWTSRCFKRADCVLVVGLGHNKPSISPLEIQLENVASRAQKELVLLHAATTVLPSRTAEWLELRTWVGGHHHIRVDTDILPDPDAPCDRAAELGKLLDEPEDELVDLEHGLLPKTTQELVLSDCGRLARHLTGCSIGLTLGGGGARGIAHLGVIQVLEEAGVPIDMVGGTSIGSFIGGLYAMHRQYKGGQMQAGARKLALGLSNYFLQALDLTYPITSMFTGRQFNRVIEEIFGNHCIEDSWIPYFCITTDVSASQMRVHTRGSMWRYVRSSMSLAGYLPPLCDPVDGHLLLDGGYVNNVPTDIMRSQGAKTVLSVDVGAADVVDFTNFGDELSGLWLLWCKWNPFKPKPNVPDMQAISSRLAYICSSLQMDHATTEGRGNFYLRPPIEPFGTLQWTAFDTIESVGKEYMQLRVDEVVASLAPDRFGSREKPEVVHAAEHATDDLTDDEDKPLVPIASLPDMSPVRRRTERSNTSLRLGSPLSPATA
eukprot:m.145382 g.145382  ORF g.145382 m.145382 type:complete len:1146 (-) comp17222_c1_seq3:169-3606(-)